MTKRRKVWIELIAIVPMDVPSEWDEEMINFHLNESSHCLTNEVEALYKEYGHLADDECMCHRLRARYISDLEGQIQLTHRGSRDERAQAVLLKLSDE